MKWKIKLGMENLTDGLTVRHSLPTRMCFILFPLPLKNFEILLQPHIGTFAFATTAKTKRNGKVKRTNFSNALF